jgi:ferredoxin
MMSSFVEADSSECTFCEAVLVVVESDDVAACRRGCEENRLRRTEGREEAFAVRGSVS